MKVCYSSCRIIGLFVLFSILITACVNHISEEGEGVINDGNIVLKFIADIHGRVATRVVNNTFQEGDEVGLFALAGSTTMQEERYADNIQFVRSADGDFLANESVYYPDDGVTLKLISYYPYQKEGVAMGESTMQVSIKTTQSVQADYSHSDFLVATKEGLVASKEAVSLTYNHKFFRLKVVLVPGKDEVIEDMLAANPELSISGFYTNAIYDFQKDTYTGYSKEEEVTLAGEWKIESGRLVGKDVILIPQEATVGYQHITLKVGGKPYTSLLPSTLQLQSGKQRELAITFVSDEDFLIGKVNGEIGDWEGSDTDSSESETLHKYVDISKLTFEKSGVYKVLSAGRQVAEICKEYLVTSEFSAQAIVAYPMKTDDDSKVDLSQGTVVRLLGQEGKVHGGMVSWNLQDHSLTYTPGTMSPRNYVYVMTDGKVALSLTEDGALPVLALSDIIRDVRGGMFHNYPIVKIGTQYWMQDNLQASLYTDGEIIPTLTEVTGGATGCLLSENKKNYFYTSNVIKTSNKLTPANWSIPDWNDWTLLKTYLGNDASLLKAGEWEAIKKDGVYQEIQPVTNFTGFNGLPVGMYLGALLSDYESKYVAYWTLNDDAAQEGEVFLIYSSSAAMERAKVGTTKAFAIRCIRK